MSDNLWIKIVICELCLLKVLRTFLTLIPKSGNNVLGRSQDVVIYSILAAHYIQAKKKEISDAYLKLLLDIFVWVNIFYT